MSVPYIMKEDDGQMRAICPDCAERFVELGLFLNHGTYLTRAPGVTFEQLRKLAKEAHQYSVVQFFEDDTYEYVARALDAKTAVEMAKRCTESVGAKGGLVRRIIITDGGDHTNFEWRFGEGVVFPRHDGTRYVGDD